MQANATKELPWRVVITNQQSKSFQDNKMPEIGVVPRTRNESCVRQVEIEIQVRADTDSK